MSAEAKSFFQVPLLNFAPQVTELFQRQVRKNTASEYDQELLFLAMRPLLRRDLLPIAAKTQDCVLTEKQR